MDKASWILKKQKEHRETKPELIKPSFKEDTTLPYLGKNYPIIITAACLERSVCQTDKTLQQINPFK